MRVEVLESLKHQLELTIYSPPLNSVNFEYGFNTNELQKIIQYWLTKYNWQERQKLLNSVPHFRTKILGLNIHYIHLKPNSTDIKNKKILPLLLLHGWPGSVKEFYKIFPLLITPQKDYDFVFEVIAPSLPGYGYSDAATIPGLSDHRIAQIMKLLMDRIGFDKFYVQGGDWGSLIGTDLATFYPKNVIGLHSNLCPSAKSFKSYLKMFIGALWSDFIVEREFRDRLYPLAKTYLFLIEESGYFHLQATKPDTIGVALLNSPAGLAAYILEKFSTWVNPNNRYQKDGGLSIESLKDKNYSLDDLLDNVMIYYTTKSITTSMRLYSETFNKERQSMNIDSVPSEVPTVCTNYPHELYYPPESIIREKFPNLLYVSHQHQGGHFAAFEQPQIFTADLWKSISDIEDVVNNKKKFISN